jgi:hypothetical protein
MPEIQQSEITSAASGARQLGARAHQLASQGRLTEALESARKSVEQWRILAKQDSSNFLPELARSLDRLAIFLARAEIAGEAFEAAKESVRHWRQLAAANLERFGLELAGALRRLAADALGLYPRDFLSMREEATNVLLRLAAANPALLPQAAEEASRMSGHFSRSGEPKKALQYGRQAVELWRVLAAKDLVQFGGGLVLALRQLAVDQTTPNGVADKGPRKEARRVALSRFFRLLRESVRPKALGAVFTAVATGKALRPARSPSHRRG